MRASYPPSSPGWSRLPLIRKVICHLTDHWIESYRAGLATTSIPTIVCAHRLATLRSRITHFPTLPLISIPTAERGNDDRIASTIRIPPSNTRNDLDPFWFRLEQETDDTKGRSGCKITLRPVSQSAISWIDRFQAVSLSLQLFCHCIRPGPIQWIWKEQGQRTRADAH